MTQTRCSEFAQELATMSDQFSDLGERLLTAARQLHSPGSPPLESLINDLSASRQGFNEFRDRIRDHAQHLGLEIPAHDSLETLQSLSTLIDEATEVEIGRVRGEEIRRRALSVLDRATYLVHRSSSEFAPLNECVDRARQLRQRIAESDWSQLPEEAESLGDGDHPLAHLLILVENRDDLNDDHWALLHDSVGNSYGKPLAAAAARSKLDVSGDAPPLPDDLVGAALGDRGGFRRNLGSATPSSY